MQNSIELGWQQLKNIYKPNSFVFKGTSEETYSEGIIGQGDAIELLEFGMKLDAKGYNIYISGEDEPLLYDYIMQMVSKMAEGKSVPDDLCYIHNFNNPSQPIALKLQAGDGIALQEDMETFKQFLMGELPWKLESFEAEKKRQKLITEMEDQKDDILSNLKKDAKELGFIIKVTQEGIGFLPLDEEGKPLTEEEYAELDDEIRVEMKKKLKGLYELSDQVLKDLRELEKMYQDYVDNVDDEIVAKEVGHLIKRLKEKYQMYEELAEYFDLVSADLLENIRLFTESEDSEGKQMSQLFPWLSQKGVEDIINKYSINLIVDHKEQTGAPVITSINLSYNKLVGKIQVETELQSSTVDFNHIRGGLLHEANGGYLIVYAQDLLEYPGAWAAIKRTLRSGEIVIDNLASSSVIVPLKLSPEPVSAQMKVIVIGPYEIYAALKAYDPYFKELFKICVDFVEQVDNTKENIQEFSKYIKGICEKQNLQPIDKDAMVELVHYSNRLADHQKKLSSNLTPIAELLREANEISEGTITKDAIVKVRKLKNYFMQTIQKNMDENFMQEILLVDTLGKKVGQINGLAVYGLDQFSFGKPVRITVTTYRGKSGVIDVEKEAGLSGNIHSKGIQIITGFLGHQFAQKMPLSLSCRICFEQSYGMIDGDSASSAELYGILSSLSDIPINQGIAVTGSINQYGQIQPIGGVNEKIEGFFRVCQKRGLTGKQGVMIPYQNKVNLVLEDEVVEAVKKGQFHIYAVKDFREGIEVLTDVTYEEIEKLVVSKLKQFNGVTKESKRSLKKNK
ncbi:MAG: Lon protease family protein [Cellulosilyticaceae bacterium]